MNKEEKIQEVLNRGVENIYPSKDLLERRLRSGKKIRLYCGFDPTASSLQIGNAIQIRKLAQFQELGHQVIFLIGDFTGMIGDPTDKTSARKKMTRQELLKNTSNYKKQISKILKLTGNNPAKIMYNSQWSDKLTFCDLIEVASNFTVGQMIVRDMFQKRIKEEKPIYLHEFLYPLAQGYDSVAMNVDLEVGGNDQTFNMLCGRDLIKIMKNKEKFVLTTKLLVDAEGKKVGKTEGNVINLNENPQEIYGKVMSWPDDVISLALELCTNVPMEEIKQVGQDIKSGKINPRDAKAKLAYEIVSIHHNQKNAQKAAEEFNRIFREKKEPSNIPFFKTSQKEYNLLDLLVESNLCPSKSKAKQLINQGAVKINNQVIKNWQEKISLKDKTIVQSGKRKFIQIKLIP
jgi:tyrosyl-tRNA synthetase